MLDNFVNKIMIEPIANPIYLVCEYIVHRLLNEIYPIKETIRLASDLCTNVRYSDLKHELATNILLILG